MQVVVRQFNGLGNQLFQYAAGRYLAKKYGASLRIAHELAGNPAFRGEPRAVLLHKFAIAAAVGPVNLLDRLLLSTRPKLAAAGEIARAARKIQVIRQAPDDIRFEYDFQISEGSRVAYLVGYWQAYSIVREIEAELRHELRLVEPPRGRNLEVAERICAAQNPVSVHLRRGDYVAAFGTAGLLPMTYYDRAIKHMMDRHDNCSFFIFSDDTAFAKQWARGNSRLIVVDHNDADSAHEDLRLMSLCRRHVIANSTFSWWGAWLNQRADKEVVAPDNWLGFDTQTMPIASPDWTLMPTIRAVEHSARQRSSNAASSH